MEKQIVRVENLKKWFDLKGGILSPHKFVKAVDNVSFIIHKGETLGLVGESGCGKSTLGRTLVRIYKPTDGSFYYDNVNVSNLSEKQFRPYRKKIQMIFQDPYASLNPRLTVGEIITEPMVIHKLYTKSECKDRVQELLQVVGLKPDHIRRYPHEFSGGQRQRIGIARTLALDPEFIVCDEPISALDVSIQAQIINLLEKIQSDRGISYLFIAHDLSMVKHICHRIGVMYLGNLVEVGDSNELYKNPLHPYTKALLSSAPIPDPVKAKNKVRIVLEGEIPSPLNPPSGCAFRTRCPNAKQICADEKPTLKDIGMRQVACHFID